MDADEGSALKALVCFLPTLVHAVPSAVCPATKHSWQWFGSLPRRPQAVRHLVSLGEYPEESLLLEMAESPDDAAPAGEPVLFTLPRPLRVKVRECGM